LARALPLNMIYNFETAFSIYKMLSTFRNNAILGIGGMTMNERRYRFCLFDEFDACCGNDAKQIIYIKLLAAP
jgi:hypothetical protein